MTFKYYGKEWTLKQLAEEWQKKELDIAELEAVERKVQDIYNFATDDIVKSVTEYRIKIIQAEIARQLGEQSEIETILIENEAPGWTST